MGGIFSFDHLIESLRGTIQNFPDKRTWKNLIWTMEDAALVLSYSLLLHPNSEIN